jgi:hypothetical protein
MNCPLDFAENLRRAAVDPEAARKMTAALQLAARQEARSEPRRRAATGYDRRLDAYVKELSAYGLRRLESEWAHHG